MSQHSKSDLELEKERNYQVVKSNEFIQKSRYSLSLVQQRIIFALMQKIKPEDSEFKEYEFSIPEFLQICGLENSGYQYTSIKKAILDLKNNNFWIDTEEKSIAVGWLSKAVIDKKTGKINLVLDNTLRPYLLNLKSHFTKLNFLSILSLKSRYSIRLYEILKSYLNLNEVTILVEDLKIQLECQNYKRWADFKRKVLDTAVDDINANTELQITYDLLKKSRTINKIVFHIEAKSTVDRVLINMNSNLRLNS